MQNNFSRSKIKFNFIFFFLICLIVQTVSAFEAGNAEVLETEKEAKELSKVWSGEKIRRSIVLYEKAAEDWKKPGEMKKAAEALRESAKLSYLFSDYEKAYASLDKALKIDEKINNTEGKIISLSLISEIYRQKGETEKSQKYYKQAIRLSEQTTDALAKTYAFYSAGNYQMFYGNTKTTVDLLKKAIFFANQTEDKQLITEILLELGGAFGRVDEFDKELESYNEALKISIEENNERGESLSYFNIGFHYYFFDKQLALDNQKKALEGFPDDIDWLHKARIFNSMAAIYEGYGDLIIAEKYRTQALENFERAAYPTGVLTTLTSLASIKELNGDTETAKKLYERALTLAKKLKDEFQIGLIKEDFGDIAIKNGDYDAAIENYQSALAINRKIKLELPQVQNRLGKAFEKKGELKLAQEQYLESLDISMRIKDFPLMAENYHSLAHLSVALGNFDKALEYSNDSIKFTESVYTDVDNNKLRRTFLSSIYDRYSLNINLLMKMHERFPDRGFALNALQISEKSRSRSLLETLRLSEAEFIADADPNLVKQESKIREKLNENADKLTRSLTSGAAKDEIKNIEDEINELQDELEKIKGELKSKSPVYSSIKNPQDFDVREFQQNVLDENSLFLEFSFGENESYLWLIGQNSFNVVTLPKRQILEDELNEIYDLLISRQLLEDESIEDYRRRITENERKFQNKAQILSNSLFGQVSEKLKDKRLILATDGKLRYFPVSALPFPNNTEDSKINEPILLTNEIIYEPSAAILNLLTRKLNPAKTPEKDLLIFADPVYSSKDERINSANSDPTRSSSKIADDESLEQTSFLERLPATEQEAASIVKTFGWSDTKLLSGFSATRENFFEINLSDYKVLHFATHGLLNEEQPEFSSLVFSQFDENGKRKKGIVRLQDIYSLNLQADLVVLSACDTGIGKDIKGEGLISLTDGFLQAGAKTVISSRWKVSDKATLELMKNFYDIMEAENLPPSKALQKAKIKLRESPAFASPYHWAAFTIQGDYQNKPNLTNGSGLSKYLLIPISVLILLGIFFCIRKFR